MISYRGLGLTQEQCTGGAYTGQSFWQCLWAGIAGYDQTGGLNVPIAVPAAPTGSALTKPPANEEEAKALVDQMMGTQWANQQAINAGIVQPVFSIMDYATGGTGYGDPPDCTKTWTALVNSECPPIDFSQYYIPILIGVGVLALAFGGGSSRRYGR